MSRLFAFLGGALAFLLVYSLSWKSGLDPLRMILVGIAVNALFTGLGQALGFSGGCNRAIDESNYDVDVIDEKME